MEIVPNKRQQVAFFKVREGAYINSTVFIDYSITHGLNIL